MNCEKWGRSGGVISAEIWYKRRIKNHRPISALVQEKKAADDPRRQLDLSGLPDRNMIRHRDLDQSLAIMTPGLVVMVLTYGLCLLLTFYRFQRYELS